MRSKSIYKRAPACVGVCVTLEKTVNFYAKLLALSPSLYHSLSLSLSVRLSRMLMSSFFIFFTPTFTHTLSYMFHVQFERLGDAALMRKKARHEAAANRDRSCVRAYIIITRIIFTSPHGLTLHCPTTLSPAPPRHRQWFTVGGLVYLAEWSSFENNNFSDFLENVLIRYFRIKIFRKEFGS